MDKQQFELMKKRKWEEMLVRSGRVVERRHPFHASVEERWEVELEAIQEAEPEFDGRDVFGPDARLWSGELRFRK